MDEKGFSSPVYLDTFHSCKAHPFNMDSNILLVQHWWTISEEILKS